MAIPSAGNVPMPRLGLRPLLSTLLLAPLTFAPAAGAQELPRWRVEPEPVTSIGELDGPPGQLLTNVLEGTVLSNGSMVLLNSTQSLFEIRYHAPDGRHLRTVSGQGAGPFEFHGALGLHPLEGDSVLVLGRDDRFAVFGPEGEEVREGRAGLGPVMPLHSSIRVDPGHVAAVGSSGSSGMPEAGVRRGEVRVVMHDLESRETHPVATLPSDATYYEAMPGTNGVYVYPAPFGPRLFVAGGGGMLWVGDSALPLVRGYRPGSDEPAIMLRLPGPRREVGRRDRARIREMYETMYSGERRERWARVAASMDIPEHMPWYGGLEVDRVGNLWVQAYEPPGADGPQRWSVYSREGTLIATVDVAAAALPPCARRLHGCTRRGAFLEIGDDYFLVRQSDELGVVRVQRYPLVKGG